MENKGLQAVITAALTAFTIYFNALAVPLFVLLIMMVIDYISGMSAAWREGMLNSKKGVDGIIKKVGYMGLVAVAMGVDYLIFSGFAAVNVSVGFNMFFGILVAVWLIINEMISILENLSGLGVPIPNFLTKAVKKLKITAETKGEKLTEESEEENNDR